jgi:hypothetical protein
MLGYFEFIILRDSWSETEKLPSPGFVFRGNNAQALFHIQQNNLLKGSLQRKVTGVKNRIKRTGLISHNTTSLYFLILKGHYHERSKKTFKHLKNNTVALKLTRRYHFILQMTSSWLQFIQSRLIRPISIFPCKEMTVKPPSGLNPLVWRPLRDLILWCGLPFRDWTPRFCLPSEVKGHTEEMIKFSLRACCWPST